MPAQTVIKVRRDTAANWISADPTLASGEIGFETDTNQLKIGNGSDEWTVLPYASGSGGASVEISETAPAEPEEGDVWFNSTDGRAYIYYDSTWVDLNPGIAGPTGPAGAAGAPGPGILASATAPEDTTLVWYNTENGNAYTYYDGFWTSITGPSIPVGGTTGQVLAKSSSVDYATEWVTPKILQVVSITKTDTFTLSSTSLTDITGVSATITPSSSSSKVLIILSLNVDASADLLVSGDITRAGTQIGIGDVAGSRIRTGWIVGMPSGNRNHNLSYTFLDSPATTSSTTYQARVRSNAGTIYVNRSSGDSDNTTFSRSVSTITLMEVAG